MSTRAAALSLIVLAGFLAGLWTLIPLSEVSHTTTTIYVRPAPTPGQPIYPTTKPATIEEMRREFDLPAPARACPPEWVYANDCGFIWRKP